MQVLRESRLSLSEAAEQASCNVSTVWRWAQAGVKGRKLETQLIGGRRYTSAEALERFIEAINGPAGAPAPLLSAKQREAAHNAAERELAKDGI